MIATGDHRVSAIDRLDRDVARFEASTMVVVWVSVKDGDAVVRVDFELRGCGKRLAISFEAQKKARSVPKRERHRCHPVPLVHTSMRSDGPVHQRYGFGCPPFESCHRGLPVIIRVPGPARRRPVKEAATER